MAAVLAPQYVMMQQPTASQPQQQYVILCSPDQMPQAYQTAQYQQVQTAQMPQQFQTQLPPQYQQVMYVTTAPTPGMQTQRIVAQNPASGVSYIIPQQALQKEQMSQVLSPQFGSPPPATFSVMPQPQVQYAVTSPQLAPAAPSINLPKMPDLPGSKAARAGVNVPAAVTSQLSIKLPYAPPPLRVPPPAVPPTKAMAMQ